MGPIRRTPCDILTDRDSWTVSQLVKQVQLGKSISMPWITVNQSGTKRIRTDDAEEFELKGTEQDLIPQMRERNYRVAISAPAASVGIVHHHSSAPIARSFTHLLRWCFASIVANRRNLNNLNRRGFTRTRRPHILPLFMEHRRNRRCRRLLFQWRIYFSRRITVPHSRQLPQVEDLIFPQPPIC